MPWSGVTPPDSRLAAIILAGGRGRRMDERDKGLIELAGRPLVERVIDRLRPQVDEIVISANRHLDRYADFGPPVVPDTLPDRPGPLAGILAAATRTEAAWLLVAPCDTPFLPANLAERMLATARRHDAKLVRAADPERTHFAVMLMHRSLLADLADALAAGEHRVHAWQARHRIADTRFDDPTAFFNVNTEDDLLRACHLLAM